jgi:hypothetical protein
MVFYRPWLGFLCPPRSQADRHEAAGKGLYRPKRPSKVVSVDTPDEGAGLRISMHVLCPEHSRLLQHYEAALRRWALAEWSSNRNEPNASFRVSAEISKKALDERDAARERLNLHEQSCPTCIHNHHNPHLVK